MNKKILLAIATLACAVSCNKEPVQAGSGAGKQEEVKKVDSALIPGEVIVQFDPGTTEIVEKQLMRGKIADTGLKALDNALAALHATGITRLYPDAGEWEPRHREAGLHQWYRISYNEEKAISTKAGESPLDAVPGIIYKEPVRKIKSLGTDYFNDPRLSSQWHYYNDGSKTGWTKGADINVLPVWKEYTAGSKEVIVAVVDGGIDMNHEDLNGVVIAGGSNGSRNFVRNNYTITEHDHGTHVGGTIGAINNNGKGVCGIAGGNDGTGGVKLLSCQVFDDAYQYGNGFYEAMVWGADHGAVISQNSWGNEYYSEADALNGSVGSMKPAIDYFIKSAGVDKNGNQTGPMKGGVVFFAAGNDNWSIGWPAAYENDKCIAVGSISSNGTRAYYSNYGRWVDIAAPGGDAYVGHEVLSTIPGGYGSMQGTSMACPHVSGVAALLVSHFGGPGFTNDMLVERLLGGANKDFIQASTKPIGPLVDAYGAFKYGQSDPPEKVADYEVEGTGGNINFSWTVTADPDDGKAFAYLLLASEDKKDFENLRYTNLPSKMKKASVETGDLEVGEAITGNVAELGFSTKYYTAIVAYDYGKNYSEISEIKEVTTTENQAPAFETAYKGEWKIKANQILEVIWNIYDPDFHSITVNFESNCPYATSRQLADGSFRLTIDGIACEAGEYTASYTAKDSYGKVARKNIHFEVLPNHAPVVKKQLENLLLESVGEAFTINIDDYLYDEDGDVLKFEVEHSNPKILHINPSENKLTMTSLSYGMDEITIHAYDIKKAEGMLKFSVKVRNPKSEADIYPTQVTDALYIGGGKEAKTLIIIYNSNGTVAYQETTVTSAFKPAKVDMSGFAPGIYTVKVAIEGRETTRTVVKL